MEKKKRTQMDSLMEAIYTGVKQYFVGVIPVDPSVLKPPPPLIANKDFYEDHMEKILRQLRLMGDAFPTKEHLVAVPNVSPFLLTHIVLAWL